MLKQVKQFAITMFAIAALAAPASAATVIDFATGSGVGVGGNIYWQDASMTNVIGTDIPIGRLLASGTPIGSGDYAVFGTAFGDIGGAIFGDLDFDTSTGDISITGCVPGLVGAAAGATSCDTVELLLSGTITSFSDVFGTSNFVAVAGVDFKNATLLENLGLDPDLPFVLTGSVQTGVAFGVGPDSGQPSFSTDVVNTAIPEPATMMLLGTGLLAAFRARRKQQQG